jgi:hypothetical protein
MRTLNKIFPCLLIAFTFIIVVGCDDGESINSNSQLIGLWRIESVVISECTDPSGNGTSTCGADPSKCETLEIKQETLSVDGEPFVSYSVSGNTITYNGDTWTYSVTNTTLTLTYKFPGDCKEVSTYKKI